MTKTEFLKRNIARLYTDRNDGGMSVFGERGMVDHWDWHKVQRKELQRCVEALRGTAPTVANAATPAQFKRDNPESVR